MPVISVIRYKIIYIMCPIQLLQCICACIMFLLRGQTGFAPLSNIQSQQSNNTFISFHLSTGSKRAVEHLSYIGSFQIIICPVFRCSVVVCYSSHVLHNIFLVQYSEHGLNNRPFGNQTWKQVSCIIHVQERPIIFCRMKQYQWS